MKLYMVTDGDCSDYCVRGIYSTPEKAEWAKKLYAAKNDIDEIEVDALPDAPPGMLWYFVKMDVAGNSPDVRRVNAGYAGQDKWAPYGDNEHVSFYQWAEDEQHAVKIANERRAQLIANGGWITDWKTWRAHRN